MDRKGLQSAAVNYPYLQGLWTIPFGFVMVLVGLSNLQHRPADAVMLGVQLGGLAISLMASLFIARYYRQKYGRVMPTNARHVRQGAALAVWIAVLFIGGGRFLFWSLQSPICIFALAFALATLLYYAILVGLRRHHVLIWGAVVVAALLPIWGGLGADRDAVAMFPLGIALIASGLLDQRLLMRARSLAQEGRSVAG